MALPGVCHGSARSRSWLYQESVMTLPGVCQGAATESVIAVREIRQGGILPVEALASLHR